MKHWSPSGVVRTVTKVLSLEKMAEGVAEMAQEEQGEVEGEAARKEMVAGAREVLQG